MTLGDIHTHRGLERTSVDALRGAKIQRLTSEIDGFDREIDLRSSDLAAKVVDMFLAGQLAQSELIPFCQEIVDLQQQLDRAQAELDQLQGAQSYPQNNIAGVAPPPGLASIPLSEETGIVEAPPPPVNEPTTYPGATSSPYPTYQPTVRGDIPPEALPYLAGSQPASSTGQQGGQINERTVYPGAASSPYPTYQPAAQSNPPPPPPPATPVVPPSTPVPEAVQQNTSQTEQKNTSPPGNVAPPPGTGSPPQQESSFQELEMDEGV